MADNTYTSVTISGYNANPPPDDGSQTTANKIRWSTHKSKIGDPLKTGIEAVNANVSAAIGALAMTNNAGEADVVLHMRNFYRRFT